MKIDLQKLYNGGCQENTLFKNTFAYRNGVISNIIDKTNYAAVSVELKQDKNETIVTIRARSFNVNTMDYQDIEQFRKFTLNCNGKKFASQMLELLDAITRCCCFTDDMMRERVLERFIRQVG